MEPNWALARKRQTLIERARIVQTIRAFFIDRDFLEVETPHRIPANAPEEHIDAVSSDSWFLHTSPELCMKRLLAAGFRSRISSSIPDLPLLATGRAGAAPPPRVHHARMVPRRNRLSQPDG